MHLALLAVFTYFMQESTCASPPTSLKGIGKILGGKPSKMGEYPFILSLEDNGSQFCGASAIGDYWALTAAHCVDVSARESETYELRAGTLTKGINGTVHHVTKVIVHHGYNYRQLDNDIALIQVAEPFSKNKYVKYVRLPDQGEITPVGTKAWVAGWGLTKPNQQYQEKKTSKKGRKCVETLSFCSHFSSQRIREARFSRFIYTAELFVNVLEASPHLGHCLA
ncbi:unnamed protein product [Timema podura]|uniref:Peptidase S1 domain-containing protein n=1 Tax=Timema podura TaxID=61482 RepID=A0ABN7NUE9_TIMPD|nr:unnamed protein product [Timema podura]